MSSGAYQSPGWNSHDLVVSNTRASRFYHLKLEEGELNDAYSHSMLNFRLFMSDFRLLLRLGFNFAISHSLRVKEQVFRSLTVHSNDHYSSFRVQFQTVYIGFQTTFKFGVPFCPLPFLKGEGTSSSIPLSSRTQTN